MTKKKTRKRIYSARVAEFYPASRNRKNAVIRIAVTAQTTRNVPADRWVGKGKLGESIVGRTVYYVHGASATIGQFSTDMDDLEPYR